MVDYQGLLQTLAEVSVALAGFSGVVSVFGGRHEGGWRGADRLQLSFMLESSLAALFFSLVPFALLAAEVDLASTWRAMSALYAIVLVVSNIAAARRFRALPAEQREALGRTYSTVLTTFEWSVIAVQLANAAFVASFFLYLIGLIWLLLSAASAFVRLLGFSGR